MKTVHGILFVSVVSVLCGCGSSSGDPQAPLTGNVRVGYLHHSTGGNVWAGGVPAFIQAWAAPAGSTYAITDVTYPSTSGGYPWANYPYDYWNLWVAHAGASRDRGEQNLDDLAAAYDVIVFKHCFPVSGVGADAATSSVESEDKTIGNYKLQYAALEQRLHEFPGKRFIVWTGAALTQSSTDPASAQRAKDFFDWVTSSWDEAGDNIYVWDFRELETDGGLYLLPANASGGDSHPNATFSARAAPLIGKRIVDVIEGRGDTGSLTGE